MPFAASVPDAFISETARILPPDAFVREPSELAEYGRDWTKVFDPNPSAIAFPRTTHEVSSLLALCNRFRVAVVPSGGRTGLAGGAVAMNGEVVVSLSRMRRMDSIDLLGATVRVQAGAVTAAVHAHCEPSGFTWPVDFASKGSSHVGGNIATNAGGVKVIRYGLTRQWVLGLEVVLADGSVLELNGALEKNNTGIDLRQWFIGSEGVLGIITEATLKLARLPEKQDVFLFGVPDLAAVLTLFREARRGPFTLSAYEFFTDKCLARVRTHRQLRPPFAAESPFYVLLELEARRPDELEAWAASIFERAIATDGTLAQHSSEAAALWQLRESISESLSATGLPHKNDISIPIAALDPFCRELGSIFETRYPGWEIALFGHIGDGNLHVNVMKPDSLDKKTFLERTKDADRDLFALVQKHGGSISAEHGIGLLKKPYLPYSRSAAEIQMMKSVKRLLDPNNILNPGKIFDLE